MRRAARVLVRLAVLGGLAGAPPSHSDGALRDVPFEPLADGESHAASSVMLTVAQSARQASLLARFTADPDVRERMASVDFRRSKVVGILVGPMGSSGHRIAVQSVEADTVSVRITVRSIPPPAGHNANDVISYPYAIIAVPAQLMPARGAWSVVGTAGELLIPARRPSLVPSK
jgi:hypothetical protein